MLEKLLMILKEKNREPNLIIDKGNIILNTKGISILFKGNKERVRYYVFDYVDSKYKNIDKKDLYDLIDSI